MNKQSNVARTNNALVDPKKLVRNRLDLINALREESGADRNDAAVAQTLRQVVQREARAHANCRNKCVPAKERGEQ